MGSHFRKAIEGLETYPDLRIYVLLAAKISFFSLLAATSKTHSAARVRAARAHHARALHSSKTTTTAGVRVLLEWSVARVPLGATAAAAAAAAAECSCARDYLVTPCLCLSRARCA